MLAMASAEVNPQAHLWILQAKVTNVQAMRDKKGDPLSAEAKTPVVMDLLKVLNESLKLLPAEKENRWYHRLAEVCSALVNLLIQIKKPMIGLAFLRRCVQKTQSHPQEFTAIHAHLARLSLKAKCYHHNLKYFKIDFIDIKSANTVLREDTALKVEEQKSAEEPNAKKAKPVKPGKDAAGAGAQVFSMQFINEQTLGEKEIKRR